MSQQTKISQLIKILTSESFTSRMDREFEELRRSRREAFLRTPAGQLIGQPFQGGTITESRAISGGRFLVKTDTGKQAVLAEAK